MPPSLVPTATSAPSARGLVPVDGVGRVDGADGRVDEDDRRRVGVDGRAAGQQELLGAGRALEREQVALTDLHRHHDRQLHQRDEALVPPSPIGTGIERLTGAGVLGGHPLVDLGRVAVLQPPVGVGDVDAVEGVDDAVAPG